MNRNRFNIAAEFAAETRFELRPTAATPFRAELETEFERLKTRLLARQLTTVSVPGATAALRRAANEAAALAWATTVPLLVFPALFEEKTDAVVRQARRQARIYHSSPELVIA
ncbi:MAG TPA: hypothetical protein VFV81_00235 [Verrucomicrobiae bacterium]|nr:hypothetical protein [Verrucomicrobiae bacterium]